MFELVRSDMDRYQGRGGWLRNSGFWIGATFRLASWSRRQVFPVRMAFGALARLLALPWSLLCHVRLFPTTSIGPGLCLIHPRSIMIGANVVIGANCLIFHEVTLGQGPLDGQPVVGDRVDLYVGSRILGGVHIGDDVQVGANCVVTKDVPAGSVVTASPPRVLPPELIARLPRGRDALRAAQQTRRPDGAGD